MPIVWYNIILTTEVLTQAIIPMTCIYNVIDSMTRIYNGTYHVCVYVGKI